MPFGDRVIRWAAVAAVLVVAGVAGWISYWHAVEVVLRAGGESRLSAHLLPATVDGLALCASLVQLFCARYQLPVPRLARVAVGLGIGATFAANCLHGMAHGVLAAVIASWPALSLIVSYELAMWLVRASRSLDNRTTVIVDKPSGTPLAQVATLIANEPTISGKAIAQRLSLPYATALKLAREARTMLEARS